MTNLFGTSSRYNQWSYPKVSCPHHFGSSYILMKDSKGCVSAKYVGLPIYGAKKNAIWVPKTLVTNIQGPKKI